MKPLPEISSMWIHRDSNKTYTVLGIANSNIAHISYPTTVVYASTDSYDLRTKTLSSWHCAMKEIKKD